jgi:glycosyltransferase involved in cell wall biosynthesis
VRIALLGDFREEGWPSMDLVAEMLFSTYTKREAEGKTGSALDIELIRPTMRRRFSSANRGASFTVDRALNRFFDYSRLLKKRRSGFDLFHIVDHSYSQLALTLPTGRTVVTCHDLDTFRCLWEPGGAGRGLMFRAMTQRILAGLRKAAHVCCDSVATRDELVNRGIMPEQKTTVAPLGVHPAMTEAPDVIAEKRIAELLGGVAETNATYLLHVGSPIRRKRIEFLLEVVARLRQRRPGLRLLRVGGPFTAPQELQVERLGLADAIHVFPFLSPAELAVVYRRAAMLMLPSDAEGFGLPVIEAMANGTPVLASDLPVLHEVGGDAAEYARVGDVEEWCRKSEALLLERNARGQWEIRRERCRQQAAKFSWEETARLTAQVYTRVLSENKG